MSLHSGASPKPPTDDNLTRAPGPADRAVLVLEDGRTFEGRAYGARGHTLGEAVFATGMTGYQETLPDPSYVGQIVMMTAPHIGNTGMNDADTETAQIWVAGFVVRDPARGGSNVRAQGSLDDDRIAAGVVGISAMDTRAPTRHLRSAGAMRAGIFSGDALALTADQRRDAVLGGVQMSWQNLSAAASTVERYTLYAQGERVGSVAVLDIGVKTSTLPLLAKRGFKVAVLQQSTTAEDLAA